jgi:hypothetical protein
MRCSTCPRAAATLMTMTMISPADPSSQTQPSGAQM